MKQKIEGGKKSKWTAGDRLFFSMLPSKSSNEATTTPIQETWQDDFYNRFTYGGITGRACIQEDRPSEYISFIESLLQRKERETIKRVMEVRPANYSTVKDVMNIGDKSAYNHALNDWTDNINKLK